MSHYCSNSPQLVTSVRLGKQLYGLNFFTRSMPCITEIYNLFYVNGVKIVPHNIFDLLTPAAIAHWIMGDGSSSSSGLRIGTDSFTIKDCIKLVNVLIIKYNIHCSIHIQKNGTPRIYVKSQYKKILIPMIMPYMIPSMYYKLGMNENVNYVSGNSNKIRKLQFKCFSSLSRFNKGGGVFTSKEDYSYSVLALSYDFLHFFLAGLIESKGHFNIPDEVLQYKGINACASYKQNPKNNCRVASIEVIFVLKDRPLVELLKTKFGGNFYSCPNNNYIR